MAQTREDPAARRARTGSLGLSALAADVQELSQNHLAMQARNPAATAPGLLDLNYWNVELDLRICAVKAVQAATDLEIGEPDDIAERNIRVAINHLKDAAARFKQIKNAKSAHADAIIAEAVR